VANQVPKEDFVKKKCKKVEKCLLERRAEHWDALKGKPQETINHEIFLMLLNAMFMGHRRKQDVAVVYLATKEDPLIPCPFVWNGKEVEAFRKASTILEAFGYVLEANHEVYVHLTTDREFTCYVARVSGLQSLDYLDPQIIRRIRNMYWQGRKLKRAREEMGQAIPVLRKRIPQSL